MDLGMPFLLENASVDDAAALCAELGLQFVELNMSFPLCQPERVTAEHLRALQARYGIYFTFHLDEDMAPCAFSALFEIRDRDFLFSRYRDEYLQNTLRFRSVCEEASQGQVAVCIENTEQGWAPFQQEAIDLLLQSPAFALTLDTGHNCVAAYCDEPFYARHPGRLRHMHLHDATPNQCHMPLGAGTLDIAALIQRGDAAGARAVLEIKTVAALHDSVSYLRQRGLMYE